MNTSKTVVFNQEKIEQLKNEASGDSDLLIKLVVKECANQLREAYNNSVEEYAKEINKNKPNFTGYDFADMLEERFMT